MNANPLSLRSDPPRKTSPLQRASRGAILLLAASHFVPISLPAQDIPWGWQWPGQTEAHDPFAADFDGDGKADRCVVHRQAGQWHIIHSSGTDPQGIWWGWQWLGQSEAHQPFAADFDGDGKADRCVVQRETGQWHVIHSSGTDPQGIGWGWQWPGQTAAFTSLGADFDGDRKADRCIVNRQTGQWYIIHSSGTDAQNIGWGSVWPGQGAAHTPLAADFDGDGKADRCIVNRQTGQWYVIHSSGTDPQRIGWGSTWLGQTPSHIPFAADFDGDKKADRVLVEPRTGAWHILYSQNRPPSVDAGSPMTITLGEAARLAAVVSDDGRPNPPGVTSVEWSPLSGPGTVTFQNRLAAQTTAQFSQEGVYTLELIAHDGELRTSKTLTISVVPPPVSTPKKPVVSAGPDTSVVIPGSATLQGKLLSGVEPVTYQWSPKSGPGSVSFRPSGAAQCTATFSVEGVYVLTLKASNQDGSHSDDVTVNVRKNQAPIINAGPDKTLIFLPPPNKPPMTRLQGSVNDTTLPYGSLNLKWVPVSGPAVPIIASPGSATTDVTFPKIGTYRLKLTANDGNLEGTPDEVVITVNRNSIPTRR